MKSVTSIFFCLICIYCAPNRRTIQINSIDPVVLANSCADSLIKAKVDTILLFSKGCSGCISGVKKTVYVFWKSKYVAPKIKKFDTYSGVGEYLQVDDLTNYFFNHEYEIRQEVLKEPDYILSHFKFTGIRLFIQGNEFYEIDIPDQSRRPNEDKKLIHWVQHVESSLFNLERN
ncbi:MAG: hypothetical protein IT219_09800 [Bacteroidales bacterium]|nr:hypothetical protein [Bacteroidales bacterium]